jgi:RNA polymerase sigma factor (sigma-70 family)
MNRFSTSAHAKAYLATMVKNTCIDWRRKKHPVMIEMSEEEVAGDDHMILQFEKYERLKQLVSLINRLPAQLKEVATYAYVQGLSIDEMEQQLRLSREVIYVYKNRAFKQLREMILTKEQKPLFEEMA